jgi:hypothetical protein
MAASRTQIVRQLQLAAVRAFLERRRAERIMAPAHVALRRRGFSLGDSHAAPLKSKNENGDNLAPGHGRIVAIERSYSG